MATIVDINQYVATYGGTSNAYIFYEEVTLNSQSIVNNTSNITVRHYALGRNGWGYKDFYTPKSIITVNGVERVNVTVASIPTSGAKTLINSWTGDVEHNEDGTLALTVVCAYNPNTSSYNYVPKSNSITGRYNLPTIPRASDIECDSPVYMGSTQNVSVTQKSSSFSHILYYKTSLDSEYTEIGRNAGSESYSWSLPDIAVSIPDSASDTYILRVLTYLNEEYEDEPLESTLNIIANVPASYIPGIGIISIEEGNEAVPDTFPYIVGYSKLNVTTRFRGSAGSTVANRAVQVGNEIIASTSSDADVTMDFANTLTQTSNNVLATTTDSRGRTGTATQSVSAYAYATPTVQMDFTRCDQDGTVNQVGEYLAVKAKWYFDGVNGMNSAAINIYINSTLKYTHTPTVLEQTSWQQIAILSDIKAEYQYDIQTVISDLLASAYVSGTVPKATVPLSLYDDGTNLGVAVGKMATESGFRNYLDEYVVTGKSFNLLDSLGRTVLKSISMDDLFNGGGMSKFVKGTPITLYDTDGETVLAQKNPEDLVFSSDVTGTASSKVINDTQSTTSTGQVDKTYTVSGDGIVIATGWCWTDATSDSGTCLVNIYLNGTAIGRGFYRLQTAQAINIGTSATCCLEVKDGDKIQISMTISKNGTKNLNYNLLALEGCSLS